MTKTNAMRMLEKENIKYRILEYEVDENDLSGTHVAKQLDQSVKQVFKTLVLHGDKSGYLVCCIPVAEELDLKKVAKTTKDKKVEMIHMKDLLNITGYIRGGCSPIGMKKKFPVYIDETACLFEEIAISAGVRGKQILLNPGDLNAFIHAKSCDLVKN